MSSRTTKSQQPSQPQAASQQTVPQFCDFCHTKPKYGTHPYCGKNCATQAVTLCHQCNVKNKHGTHNFCGKKCAALANAGKPGAPPPAVGTTSGTTNAATNQPVAGASKGVGAGNASSNGYSAKRPWKPQPAPGATTQYPGAQQAPPFISTTLPVPFQVAPLLNHIQSLATTALSNISNLPNSNANAPANGPSAPVPAYSSIVNETLAAVLNLPANIGQATSHNGQQVTSKGQPPQKQAVQAHVESEDEGEGEEEGECRMPGCGQPVRETSEYCSTRHHDEAVALRLEEACIMCLKLPQSEKDYFCGRICREEALSKLGEV